MTLELVPPLETQDLGPVTSLPRRDGAAGRSAAASEVVNRLIPLDRLIPDPTNYNEHPEAQIEALKASIRQFEGQVRSVVARDMGNGIYMLSAGHGFTMAAREMGLTHLRVDVLPAHWSPERCRAYTIADNELARQSVKNDTLFARMLEEQHRHGTELAGLGLGEKDMANALALIAKLDRDAGALEEPEHPGRHGGGTGDERAFPQWQPTKNRVFAFTEQQNTILQSAIQAAHSVAPDYGFESEFNNPNPAANALIFICQQFLLEASGIGRGGAGLAEQAALAGDAPDDEGEGD